MLEDECNAEGSSPLVIAILLSASKYGFTYVLTESTEYEKNPNLVLKYTSSMLKAYFIACYTQVFSVLSFREINILHPERNSIKYTAYSSGWFLQKGAIVLGYYIFDPIVSFLISRATMLFDELLRWRDRKYTCDKKVTSCQTQEEYED